MIDYTIFFKERFRADELALAGEWDLLLAAFDSSERSRAMFERGLCKRKVRWAFPEYGFAATELPQDVQRIEPDAFEDEASLLSAQLDLLGDLQGLRLCIDITAFISNYVLVLLRLLYDKGIKKFDVVYTEPSRYKAKEQTKFSDGVVLDVKQLPGYEGVHNTDTSTDLLVMAVGYDHKLVAEVANQKEHTKKVQLFGLPSLRPDMYQENVLRARHAEDAVGKATDHDRHRFAPAYDPFVTAAVVAEVVKEHREAHGSANVYLAPLSTKAQALGMGLYFLAECAKQGVPTSILYPSFRHHERETSTGISGAWRYTVELP